MDLKIANSINELHLNVYTFSIEDVRFIIKTDRTFVMPTSKNISALDYTSIHHHVEHEIFFITDGDLLLNLKTESTLYSNRIVHLPAFLQHFSKASSLIYRFMLNYKAVKEEKKSDFCRLIEKTFSTSTIQTYALTESIKHYLKELDLLLKSNRVQKELRIRSLLKCIILELCDNFNESTVSIHDNVQKDYASHLEFIFNNYAYTNDLTLDFIAKELSLSTKQTSRVIQKHYNASLTDVINDKKLSASCLLLKNTDYSITEIIKHVNFKTENYFYTLFKKRYNITPLKYRKLNSNKT